jgi:hypothetical protein
MFDQVFKQLREMKMLPAGMRHSSIRLSQLSTRKNNRYAKQVATG